MSIAMLGVMYRLRHLLTCGKWVATACLLLAAAGCSRQLQHDGEMPPPEGTFRARALLTRQQQRDFDKLFLEALREKHNDNLAAARELLAAALDINPNASEALYELGKIETSNFSAKTDSLTVAMGDEMLLRAYQLEPSNPFFCRTLAQRWVERGKYNRAAALYEELTKVHPHSEDLQLLLKIYETIPDLAAALHTVERLEMAEGIDESTIMEKFSILMNMGKREEAFGVVEQWCGEHPEELRRRVMLGDLYLQNGRREQALAIFDAVMAEEPDNSLVQMALLHDHAEQGDTVGFKESMAKIMADERIDNLQKLSLLKVYSQAQMTGWLKIAPTDMLAFYRTALEIPQENSDIGELCLAYIEAAKLPEDAAQPIYDAILRYQPDHLKARFLKLVALVRQRDTKGIIANCHEAIAHHPDMLIFYYYEGSALVEEERMEEGMQVLEAGAAQAETDPDGFQKDASIISDIYQMLGDCHHSAGQTAQCYAAYDKALAYNPDNYIVLNNYAYFLALSSADLKRAEAMSRKAIEAEPDNGTYLDTYAWVLYCMGQYTQARIYIEQTFRSMSDEEREAASAASLYDHAGDIYLKCGDREQAVEHWKKAAELTQDSELLKSLTKKLKKAGR